MKFIDKCGFEHDKRIGMHGSNLVYGVMGLKEKIQEKMNPPEVDPFPEVSHEVPYDYGMDSTGTHAVNAEYEADPADPPEESDGKLMFRYREADYPEPTAEEILRQLQAHLPDFDPSTMDPQVRTNLYNMALIVGAIMRNQYPPRRVEEDDTASLLLQIAMSKYFNIME